MRIIGPLFQSPLFCLFCTKKKMGSFDVVSFNRLFLILLFLLSLSVLLSISYSSSPAAFSSSLSSFSSSSSSSSSSSFSDQSVIPFPIPTFPVLQTFFIGHFDSFQPNQLRRPCWRDRLRLPYDRMTTTRFQLHHNLIATIAAG